VKKYRLTYEDGSTKLAKFDQGLQLCGILTIEREDVVRVDPRDVLTAFVDNVESEAERMNATCHEGCSRAEHLERAFMKIVEEELEAPTGEKEQAASLLGLTWKQLVRNRIVNCEDCGWHGKLRVLHINRRIHRVMYDDIQAFLRGED
jgi:hypothetical protein